jgi:hypothetical protein
MKTDAIQTLRSAATGINPLPRTADRSLANPARALHHSTPSRPNRWPLLTHHTFRLTKGPLTAP